MKRGIGRGAAFDGNGHHAVLPPAPLDADPAGAAPPPPPAEVRRYVQPAPQRRGHPVRAAIGYFLLAVVTIVGGVVGGLYLAAKETANDIGAHSPGVVLATKVLADPHTPKQPAVALIIGYDHRAGIESNIPPRSDTIMLVRADPVEKTISMLSFPRDMRVDIHCPNKPIFASKINSAYETCGETGTLETVEALTGIPINYLVTVDFHGFKQIVDKLGGVWIDVDHRYYNKNVGTEGTNYANIDLQPGYQRLNGSQSLDYARFRHTDSDLYRVARQQLFIQGLKQQAESSLTPERVDQIIGALRRNVEIGIGGGKQLDLTTLYRYARFMYALPNGRFFRDHIPQDGLVQDTASSDLLPNMELLHQTVVDFMNPQVDAPAQAAAAARIAKLKKKKAAAPAPAATSVLVLNGNGVTGSASTASSQLAGRGYRMVTPPAGGPKPNAPNFNYLITQVYYAPAWKPGKAAATALSKLFTNSEVAPLAPDIRPLARGAHVVVVVGRDYQGSIAAPPTPVIVHHAPNVRAAASETLPVVRALKKQVPFNLAAPLQLDSSSRFDYSVPTRCYRLSKDHKACRLIFKSAQDVGGYWGIEETDWADAPILQSPSYTRKLNGRTFDFYLTGSHVHMVVVHGRGNTRYWVENTLLDLLSNETMVAVAKSLRVLPR